MGATRTEVEAYLDAGVEFRKACRLWPTSEVALKHYPLNLEFKVYVRLTAIQRKRLDPPLDWSQSHSIHAPLPYKLWKSFPYKRREA